MAEVVASQVRTQLIRIRPGIRARWTEAAMSGVSGGASTFEWAWNGTPVPVRYDLLGPEGDGNATVLLLPAFSTVSTRDEMRLLAEQLATRFGTVTPDWPGFGAGTHPALDHGPGLHLSFLRVFRDQVLDGPVAVVAAGHAAGYALALARERPGTWTRIALIAPTWRGPLPTTMGGYRPLRDRLRAPLRLPGIGHALYRLNVADPVIATMYRRHVYADPNQVTPAFVVEKAKVARRRGGRFGSAVFVTGALDPVRDRGAFLALASPPAAPTLVIYGADTPPRWAAEIEAVAALPGVAAHRLAAGALGLHEECAAAGAAALRPFLLAAERPGHA